MKFVLSFWVVTVFSLFCHASEKKAVENDNMNSVKVQFADIPKMIKEKSGNVKAAQMNVSANEERTGHLARSFLPQINGTIGHENFKVGDRRSENKEYWSVGASVNLYRGGKDQLANQIIEKQLRLSKTDFSLSYSQEMRVAQSTYWEIVALEKMTEFRIQELKKNQENLAAAKRRAGAGVTTNADAVQFELNKSKIEQEIEQLHLSIDECKNRLAVILGIENAHEMRVSEDFPKELPFVHGDLNLNEQLDLRSIRVSQELEHLRAKSEGRWWAPQLDLYASYGIPSLSDDESTALLNEKETVIGLKLSIDLGQGLTSHSESKAKKYEARGLEYKAAQKEREVALLDKEIRHDIAVSARLLAENEKNVAKAGELLKLTQNEYARGLKNGPDLLGAVRLYYETLERSVELNYKILKSHAELQSLVAKGEVQ